MVKFWKTRTKSRWSRHHSATPCYCFGQMKEGGRDSGLQREVRHLGTNGRSGVEGATGRSLDHPTWTSVTRLDCRCNRRWGSGHPPLCMIRSQCITSPISVIPLGGLQRFLPAIYLVHRIAEYSSGLWVGEIERRRTLHDPKRIRICRIKSSPWLVTRTPYHHQPHNPLSLGLGDQ